MVIEKILTLIKLANTTYKFISYLYRVGKRLDTIHFLVICLMATLTFRNLINTKIM